jgi:hypothetical protein
VEAWLHRASCKFHAWRRLLPIRCHASPHLEQNTQRYLHFLRLCRDRFWLARGRYMGHCWYGLEDAQHNYHQNVPTHAQMFELEFRHLTQRSGHKDQQGRGWIVTAAAITRFSANRTRFYRLKFLNWEEVSFIPYVLNEWRRIVDILIIQIIVIFIFLRAKPQCIFKIFTHYGLVFGVDFISLFILYRYFLHKI